jgi:hypothetical protein
MAVRRNARDKGHHFSCCSNSHHDINDFSKETGEMIRCNTAAAAMNMSERIRMEKDSTGSEPASRPFFQNQSMDGVMRLAVTHRLGI